jgi:hypothetical protein
VQADIFQVYNNYFRAYIIVAVLNCIGSDKEYSSSFGRKQMAQAQGNEYRGDNSYIVNFNSMYTVKSIRLQGCFVFFQIGNTILDTGHGYFRFVIFILT